VVLALTVDEETAGMLGASALIDGGFFRFDDQVLALEPTGLRLRAAQVGVQWLSVRVTGRMAHAGRAHLGVNANHVMARLVVELEAAVAGLGVEDPVLGVPRVTVGTVRGGVATNVVAPECAATVDLRLVPGFGPQEALDLARAAAARAVAAAPGASVEVRAVGATRPPARTGLDTPVVTALDAAMRARLGRPLEAGGEDGREAYTDASLVAARLDMRSCAVWGPGRPCDAHVVDESVAIAELEDAAAVIGHLARCW
jgi:acetylornithine deacetylase/succinyl-diaminopimelate desuccinylase-like protein